MRHRVVLTTAVAVIVIAGLGACSGASRPAAGTWLSGSQKALPGPSHATAGAPNTPAPSSKSSTQPSDASATLRAPADPGDITVSGTSLFGWALLDRDSGNVAGSANDATVLDTTESMIKPWIAADYLRRLDAAGETPSATVLSDIRLMIIDSNDNMAQKYYKLGGRNAVIDRLISICKLTNTSIGRSGWWSYTMVNPVDVTRYGNCVADGQAAGKTWTPFLLKLMTQVRGGVNDQISITKQGGRWGIIDGLPSSLADTVSIKNGWELHGGVWHINCMAISTHWVLAVEMHVSGLQKGADTCASVARQLVVTS